MPLPSSLLDAALTFAREVSTEAVERACHQIETISTYESAQFSPDAARRLEAVFAEWRQHAQAVTGRELAQVLTALHFALREEASSRRAELVWTGPSTLGSPLRNTEPALLELIDCAVSSLYVVTFAAYRVPTIASAIERALVRNVRVLLVLETTKEDGGKVDFDPFAHLSALPNSRYEIYRWPTELREQDARGRYGSLHAKFAVADRKRLFVSSANLTEHALNLNIELGVVLTGGTAPGQAAMHIDALIRDGTLCRLKPPLRVGKL